MPAKFKIIAILTRNDDRSLSLEERVSLASYTKADLFISIHTNAYKNSMVQGIETYYFKFPRPSDDVSKSLPKQDDSVSTKISNKARVLAESMREVIDSHLEQSENSAFSTKISDWDRDRAKEITESVISKVNSRLEQSENLASFVQESIINTLNRHYSNVKNRGIKGAHFYLLGINMMPTILIETSFVSNPIECERLLSETYQDILCEES